MSLKMHGKASVLCVPRFELACAECWAAEPRSDEGIACSVGNMRSVSEKFVVMSGTA